MGTNSVKEKKSDTSIEVLMLRTKKHSQTQTFNLGTMMHYI